MKIAAKLVAGEAKVFTKKAKLPPGETRRTIGKGERGNEDLAQKVSGEYYGNLPACLDILVRRDQDCSRSANTKDILGRQIVIREFVANVFCIDDGAFVETPID